jgi:hypothetical protein
MGLNVAFEMSADPGDENEIAKGNYRAKERLLFGLFPVVPNDLLGRLFSCCFRRNCGCGNTCGSSDSGFQKFSSIFSCRNFSFYV